MKVYHSPAWLRRHQKGGRALRLRILTVEGQSGNEALVVAVPVVDLRKGRAKAHPARVRLHWTGEHWRIIRRVGCDG